FRRMAQGTRRCRATVLSDDRRRTKSFDALHLLAIERALSERPDHAEALSSRLLQARAREAVRARLESAGVHLTVLSVAQPLARVGRDAVGGAEQILTMLDRALVEAG